MDNQIDDYDAMLIREHKMELRYYEDSLDVDMWAEEMMFKDLIASEPKINLKMLNKEEEKLQKIK